MSVRRGRDTRVELRDAHPSPSAPALVARLNTEINKALALPDVAQQLGVEGAMPAPASPQAFDDLIRREIPRWAEVVKAGNVKPE